MTRYRIVSVAYPNNLDDMWWKIQQVVEQGEARWEDTAFPGGVNLFKDVADCIGKYEELKHNEACLLEC